jgi:PKD repeat protein
MSKIFTKGLTLTTFLLVFVIQSVLAQTITIGTVDPGPYGPGSTIAVPISVSGACINTATTYNLYLSDASGSFAAQTLIGTFSDFYATFVNGIIPNGLPASNTYAVRVVSTGVVITSTASAPFSISAGAGVVAGISSQTINAIYPEVFGTCSGTAGAVYNFTDVSSPGSTVTASFTNELTHASEGVITPTAAGAPFTANAAHYTITVKATNGGQVGTKAYLLINNTVNTSFGVTGSNTICLSGAGSLSYNVDINSANGIQNNYPGLIYNIAWGDATTSALTLCDILALNGKISHVYTKSSCGNSPNQQLNTFEVDFQPSDLYCGKVGTQVTSYAKVITAPKNRVSMPIAGCVNSPVTFINASDPGQDPAATGQSCKDLAALYTWMIDGVTVATNYNINQSWVNTFTTTGMHSVTIHLQNGSALCAAIDTTEFICIQNPPQPKFTLPFTTTCLPATLTPTNLSVIDSNCNNSNQYIWSVTGPGPVSFANNTNANSAQPQFIFSNYGVYQVQLGITTISCGTITAPIQTIYIDSIPSAILSPDITICQSNQTLSFNPAGGQTQTIIRGSSQNLPGTYTWVITGGNFTYVNGTSSTSQYPQVNFTDIATYTISVTNTNECGPPATATQHISFVQAPTVNAGPDQTICGNKQATLAGTITGAVQTMQWIGGTGTFTPSRNVLTPVYTPSTADINAGAVTLTLQATSSSPAPCNIVSSNVTINVTQPDAITSPPTFSGCSGVPINFQITAALVNSTFTWTVDPANTSATASGYAANGSGTLITDAIVNSDPVNNATVTYDITAVGGTGCSSNTFVLTVSIAPKQAIAKFTQDVTSGCDNVTVMFTNQSVPANSTYLWNFGDGTSFSNATNPVHTFAPRTDGKDTTYTITLNVSAACGNSVPFTSTVLVRPKTPIAFISPEQISGCSPFTLTVDNFSPGTNQSYTFYLYNGATLVQQIVKPDKSKAVFNPIPVNATTQYTLYMVATGFCGTTAQSNIIPITVSASNIIAQMFIANGVSKGCAPLAVNFVNNSLGADTYFYTIYDANHNVLDKVVGGTAQLPYTFVTAGTYFVTITAVNSCFTAESAPPIRVDVFGLPAPQFSSDITTGCKNIPVNFINQTPGAPGTPATSLAYDWNFGDGSPHSNSFTPPAHNYNYKSSPYTVTLTATNVATGCTSFITKAAYINVAPPPFTAFTAKPDTITAIPNYEFSFVDQTTGGPVAWKWTFGDGTTSTSQDPQHIYKDTGIYKVTLTTITASGCDSTIVHQVRITGVPGQLFLPNAFEPDGGTTALKTFMAKGSGISIWHMQVFNNYSQLVWETTKLDGKGAPIDGWDGTFKGAPAPQGVYIWQVSASFINGTEWKGNIINSGTPKRTGTIHLIR